MPVRPLYEFAEGPLLPTIGRLEPDAMLLDSAANGGYDDSWDLAAEFGGVHDCPGVMLTGHTRDVAEAEEGWSNRRHDADFSGSSPNRLASMASKARGATDVRPSRMREWTLFLRTDPGDRCTAGSAGCLSARTLSRR